MSSIRKRDRKWQVQIRRKGQRPLSRSFLTRTDAQKWAREMDRLADRDELHLHTPNGAALTVGDLLRTYQKLVVSRKPPEATEHVMVRAFLRERFCSVPLAKASTATFAEYRDRRLECVCGSTVRRDLGVLQHAFSVAHNRNGAGPSDTTPSRR